ncbi:MAG: tetratricopeptide repeat protein [Flavobacteriia bacterium]|nr:tetratricopeptide repeat protein [Flavobacteriia bacterium]
MKTLLILFSILSFQLFSQKTVFRFEDFIHEKNMDKKAKISLLLWEEYLGNNLDSLNILGNLLLKDAYEKENLFAIAVGKRTLGSYLIRNGKAEKGIRNLKEARFYFEKIGDYLLLTETLSEIGNAYNLKGEPKNALLWYEKSLQAGKQSPDPTSKFLAEINIAKAYTDLNELSKAEKIIYHYIAQAKKYKKIISEANAWTRLGIIYQIKEDNLKAKKYFEKSKNLNLKADSKIQASHGYNNIAIVCFTDGDMEGAKLNFDKALKLRIQCNNWKAIAESYFNLGELYLELKDYKKALFYYNESLKIASKKHLIVEKMDALNAIILVYKSKKNFLKAFQLMEEYSKLKSYLMEKDKEETIKSAEMDLLLFEKEHQFAQDKREMEMFEKMKKQRTNMNLLIGGFITILSVFLLFLFFNKKYSQTTKESI